MNRSLLACVATVWMACAPAQAQVYKCKDAGGRTVMQQTPCAGGAGQKLDVRPASGHQSGGGAAQAQLELERLKAETETMAAIREGRPAVGMTRQQLEQAMGAPVTVNANNYNGVLKDQLVFEKGSDTWYVYTSGGVVESIQHRPGLSAARAHKKPCPSERDLRDAQVSANSLSASRAAVARYESLLREQRECKR